MQLGKKLLFGATVGLATVGTVLWLTRPEKPVTVEPLEKSQAAQEATPAVATIEDESAALAPSE